MPQRSVIVIAPEPESVGQRLVALRGKKRQVDVYKGAKLDKSQQHVYPKWERDEIKEPNDGLLWKLETYYELPRNTLVKLHECWQTFVRQRKAEREGLPEEWDWKGLPEEWSWMLPAEGYVVPKRPAMLPVLERLSELEDEDLEPIIPLLMEELRLKRRPVSEPKRKSTPKEERSAG